MTNLWYSVSQFSCSVMSDSLQPHGLQHTRLPCPSTISQSLLKLMSIELVMPSNHLIVFNPSFFLPSVFPSIRVLSSELFVCIRWPKYWSFSFSTSPANEYSGLIFFRIDGFDWSSCSPKDFQESCPVPHFESISSVLSLLYGPTLTSIHDCWKNCIFDFMDLCWQSDVFAF